MSRSTRIRGRRVIVPPPPGTDPQGVVLAFTVAPEHAGRRLDAYVQSRIPRLSRTRARAIVEASAHHPDGRRRRPGERVRAGETVILVRPRFAEPPVPFDVRVVYEDEALLVLDKPSGLPIHPTATYHRHTLTALLRERWGEPPPRVAHRIDRETSGLVVCARTADAERCLKQAFADRKVHKTYLAIVRGCPTESQGVIDAPIASARSGLHVMMEVRDDGPASTARTRWLRLACTPVCALLALWPETGRQHQLRVHLAHIGHPIVGDKLYGPDGPALFVEHVETGMTPALAARAGHDRQALHAWRLELVHPTRGKPVEFRADPPEDLGRLWESMGGGSLLDHLPP
ncbi:MAG: RluA family pseudouridine synthase [Myxococcota bacterium]|nr:RluA family pseudouridine synthase [Myxococcota bacterium]MDW8361163.1 RluA family pseudouridine synthase [Myxococcales bacterium]